MEDGYRLLYFYRGRDADYPHPFASLLESRGWKIDPVAVGEDAPAYGLSDVFRFSRDFSSYDVVAANEYYLTWAICLRLIGTRRKPMVAAISFNQSRKLLLTGLKAFDRLLNRIWRPVTMYLVHSKAEARLFGKLHDIPAEKFTFSHWGYDLPARQTHEVSIPPTPYVSMIGRNNRDIATFCAAVDRADIHGVIVTARYMIDRHLGTIPVNVRILADRPMEECLTYIEHSLAHLVLVADGQRGAGHISAVIGMLLSKPQIFSDVGPLKDYLEHGVNGIAVGVGDVEGVADAIRTLRDDPGLATRLGSKGRDFASRSLSLGDASARAADAFSALVGQPTVKSTE